MNSILFLFSVSCCTMAAKEISFTLVFLSIIGLSSGEWTHFPIDGHQDLGKNDDTNVMVKLPKPFKLRNTWLSDLMVSDKNHFI